MEIAADVLVYLEMLLISEFAVALLVFPGVVADLEIAADVALLVFPGVVADLEIASSSS